MYFEHYSPLPSYPPYVPSRLRDTIAEYLPTTLRIDIQHRHGRSWRKLNGLHLDGETDVDLVAEEVKGCADYHAEEARRTGKYRARIWRRYGGELDRRTVGFESEYLSPDDRMRAFRFSCFGDSRRALVKSQRRLIEHLLWHRRVTERHAVELAQIQHGRVTAVASLVRDLRVLFDEGLAMQAQSARELGEARIEEAVAELERGTMEKVWATLEPLVQLGIDAFSAAVSKGSEPSQAEPTDSTNTRRGDDVAPTPSEDGRG